MIEVHRAIAEELATTLKPIEGHRPKVWNNGALWCVTFIQDQHYDNHEPPGVASAATIFIGPELNIITYTDQQQFEYEDPRFLEQMDKYLSEMSEAEEWQKKKWY